MSRREMIQNRSLGAESGAVKNNRLKSGYVPELDGLRGVAILAVMIFHAGAPFLKGGFIGVDIFFVLSGFLITSLLIEEFDNTKSVSLKNFYMRRILRLGPALILLLTVFCSLSVALLNRKEAAGNIVEALISLFYMSNWARAFQIYPPDLLGHTWSLSIEEQFYIFWPLILITLLRTAKSRWTIFFAAILIALSAMFMRIGLSISGSSAMRLYNGLDTRADSLMTGCALGILLASGLLGENSRRLLSKWLAFVAPLSAAGLIAFFVTADWHDSKMFYYWLFAIEILTACLILDIFLNERGILAGSCQ